MADMHEATFVWPDLCANQVIVTGTFDQWSSSIHLTKTPRGFEGRVKLPWGDRVLYKFVVDGRWMTVQSQPCESDSAGNLNNIYECPSKPESLTPEAPPTMRPSEIIPLVPNEVAIASVPATLTPPAMEQQTLLETAPQTPQYVKGGVITVADEIFPGDTGATSNRAHENVISPVLEPAQNIVSNPAGTLDQVDESVPLTVTETTPTMSDTAKAAADHTQTDVVPIVAPALPAARETLTEKTPEPVKERAHITAETVQTKGSGVDPLNPDKISIATPTPTRDAFGISPQEDTSTSAAPLSTFKSVPEPDPKAPVPSDAETIPTVNPAYSMASPSISSEATPVAMAPTSGTIAEKSALTPLVPGASSPFDAPSEIAAVQHPPSSDENAPNQTPRELASTPMSSTEPTQTSEAATASKDAYSSPPTSAMSSAAETTQAEAKSPEPVEPSTADPTPSDTTDVTSTLTAVDTPMATPVPDAITELTQAEFQRQPSAQATTATPGTVQAVEATPSHMMVDMVTNAANPSTKTFEATDSNKSHSFPTTESKASPSTSSPATPSKFGSARKKRVSIFGKVKNLFTYDKEEKNEKK